MIDHYKRGREIPWWRRELHETIYETLEREYEEESGMYIREYIPVAYREFIQDGVTTFAPIFLGSVEQPEEELPLHYDSLGRWRFDKKTKKDLAESDRYPLIEYVFMLRTTNW